MLFIAHDLSVVRYFSDEILVMYLGQMMETVRPKKLTPPHIIPTQKHCCLLSRCSIRMHSRKEFAYRGTCPVRSICRQAVVFTPAVRGGIYYQMVEKYVRNNFHLAGYW